MQTVLRMKLTLALLVAVVAAFACASSDTASREEVLISLTDQVIVPRFQSVATEMNGLKESLDILCAEPSRENLESARDAWRDARVPWMRSQAMWFGPVMDRRSRSLVDWSPIEPERIEKMLSERDAITAEDVREFLASTQRGFGAIEYILFQDGQEFLESAGQPGSIRCEYLIALGEVASDETNAVLSEWTGSEPGTTAYADVFNGTASSSLIGIAAISDLVRTTVFLSQNISDMRLGKALGVNGGEPDPEAIPGGAGSHAVADMRNQVLGMQDMYLGANLEDDTGLGLSELIKGLSEDSDERMQTSFAEALESIENLEEPLQVTILENPAPAREAYERLKELQRALNTEVVSLLGISVGFADTDGDSG